MLLARYPHSAAITSYCFVVILNLSEGSKRAATRILEFITLPERIAFNQSALRHECHSNFSCGFQ